MHTAEISWPGKLALTVKWLVWEFRVMRRVKWGCCVRLLLLLPESVSSCSKRCWFYTQALKIFSPALRGRLAQVFLFHMPNYFDPRLSTHNQKDVSPVTPVIMYVLVLECYILRSHSLGPDKVLLLVVPQKSGASSPSFFFQRWNCDEANSLLLLSW